VNNRYALSGGLSSKNLFVQSGGRFFLATPWHLAPLVRVLGVTRRASGLLDIFLDHRDDGVIREPPLARTVIVQYVTETQPALLHSTPPRITVYGWKKDPLAVRVV